MKNDITRNTFNALKHFSRVIHQQGRVPLDANWNEQTDILLHYLRALAEDLIGPHGGPVDRLGFEIITDPKRLEKPDLNLIKGEQNRLKTLLADGGPLIGLGRYYVDGWLCENGEFTAFFAQRDNPLGQTDSDAIRKLLGETKEVLLYLDVWERNITWIEDDHIREVALGGPDTAARAKVVWQVKTKLLEELKPDAAAVSCAKIDDVWSQWVDLLRSKRRGQLKAEVKPQGKSEDPCVTSPESRYRGVENQLYRVEVHRGGSAWNGKDKMALKTAATFKWSRENGSVVAAWLGNEGDELIVAGVHDQARGFTSGQWVELIHDELELKGEPGTLVKLTSVKGDRLRIDASTLTEPIAWSKDFGHPKVRRWDQIDHQAMRLEAGAIPIVESGDDKGWIALENGVQIQFQKPTTGKNEYRTGDYWLIPARVATGDIEWPKEENSGKWVPSVVPPHGIEHHYAPLAILQRKAAADPLEVLADLRHKIESLAEC